MGVRDRVGTSRDRVANVLPGSYKVAATGQGTDAIFKPARYITAAPMAPTVGSQPLDR